MLHYTFERSCIRGFGKDLNPTFGAFFQGINRFCRWGNTTSPKTGKDFVEIVVTEQERDAFQKAGRKVATIIPNLDTYIAGIIKSQTPDAAYFTYETMTATLQEWSKKYQSIARLVSIGKSCEGREIWAMKVSDNPDLDEKEPACLITGAHHAREWISIEVPMEALKQYLEGYGKDERLTRLVNEREVWFVPMVNPDGVTFSQTESKYWRKKSPQA